MIYYAPKHHAGHLNIPDGCTDARVYDCPGLISVTFPDGCTDAWVSNCPGLTSALYQDARGYALVYAGGFYHAGCRQFGLHDALAHWGADAYPDRARGDAYVAAINRHAGVA